jgi:hypothetical protein
MNKLQYVTFVFALMMSVGWFLIGNAAAGSAWTVGALVISTLSRSEA